MQGLYGWALVNKEWVFSGIGVFGLASVGAAVRWMIKRPEKTPLATVAPIAAPITNININNNNHNNDGGSPQISPGTFPPEEASVSIPVPFLELQNASIVTLSYSQTLGRFEPDPEGGHCLVVWVLNPAAAIWEQGKPAPAVAASVTFYDDQMKQTGMIDRAYWLEHTDNVININIGERKGIVVGRMGKRRWESWKNRNTFMSYIPSQFGSLALGQVETVGGFHKEPFFFFKVIVLGTQNGYTLAEQSFVIEFEDTLPLYDVRRV